jgi:branched-chain amino acid transport system ATP-binding protein
MGLTGNYAFGCKTATGVGIDVAVLEVKDVTRRFGGLTALRHLSFSLQEGEILGMIGVNGAGKTTAFNVISGFIHPNEGEIHFNGSNITGWRPDQICKLGLVRTFQVVKPFPEISVLDNVVIGAHNRIPERNSAHRKAFEIVRFLEMEPWMDQMAGSLPMAIRKRLEIARALATDPKLMLLDETMSGLLPGEIETMIALIERIREQGVALLLVEHVMKVIMSLADRIVVIHRGEKIAEGPPQVVVHNPAVIAAYLGKARYDVDSAG